jgi:hypothetical protein
MRLADIIDVIAIAAVAGGLGARFGWWLAAVTAGVLVLLANYARSNS